MKIVILPSAPNSQPFTLADSPDPVPMTNFRINGSINVQEAQFFRAAAREFFDRGNAKTEVSFDTTRVFNTQLDAESFALMHDATVPQQGLVTFIAGVQGRGTASRYLQNAVVESVSSAVIGCTTRHSYRIVGGIMSTTPT